MSETACLFTAICLWLLQITTVAAQNGLNLQFDSKLLPSTVIPLDADKRFDEIAFRTSSGISQYKDIYVTPLTWSEDFNNRDMEIIYQLSAKVRMFDMNLFFAYTQKSFWQAFNSGESSPFRETNYNPELFYRLPPGSKLLNELGVDAGVEHESNGRSLPVSRSWNRAYIRPYVIRSNDVIYMKLWYRFPEDTKTGPQDPSGDDNPDIQDYLGYSEVDYIRQIYSTHRIHVMVRGNPQTGKGAVNLVYDFPSGSKDMYYRFSLWNGYGESLIDYNRSITRLGIGVAFFR